MAPLPTGGDRRSVLKPHRDCLMELPRKENDLTLDAIAERLSRFFASDRISSKEAVRASEQDPPDVAERREAWLGAQKRLRGWLIFPTRPERRR